MKNEDVIYQKEKRDAHRESKRIDPPHLRRGMGPVFRKSSNMRLRGLRETLEELSGESTFRMSSWWPEGMA